ncbi:hypothetical protein ADL26_20895, partial [Thermoactinomyces vulgaris]
MHAEQPHRPEVAGESGQVGDVPALEPVPDVRGDPVVAVPADGVADGPVLVTEERFEAQRVDGVERGAAGAGGHAVSLRVGDGCGGGTDAAIPGGGRGRGG